MNQTWLISAVLLALFLGALDALVMSAAMPTIIAELSGLDLYAWVYSAYFLARAVALPVFGKLSDLFAVRRLLLISVTVFIAASMAAGAAPSMEFLVGARVFQGIGSGGIFALVYVVLSEAAPKGQRAKTLSLASFIWGVASVIGPTMGGVMVSFFSWRWIFLINLPLGLLSLAGFCASFSMFSLFGYAPLFLQGALGHTPLQVGMAMLSLSLGWSVGSLILGRVMHLTTQKTAALAGGILLVTGTGLTLGFSTSTTMVHSFLVFQVVGFGMGFVVLATLLKVQNSLADTDLGVATSSHQFARTLGGTLGVGVSGGMITHQLINRLQTVDVSLPETLMVQLKENMENLFRPEFQALIPDAARTVLKTAVAQGVWSTFLLVFVVAVICLGLVVCLPDQDGG